MLRASSSLRPRALKISRLNLLPVDPDAAAPDLGSVQDQVIGPGMDLSRIRFDEGNRLPGPAT